MVIIRSPDWFLQQSAARILPVTAISSRREGPFGIGAMHRLAIVAKSLLCESFRVAAYLSPLSQPFTISQQRNQFYGAEKLHRAIVCPRDTPRSLCRREPGHKSAVYRDRNFQGVVRGHGQRLRDEMVWIYVRIVGVAPQLDAVRAVAEELQWQRHRLR